MAGRKVKPFEKYLCEASESQVSHDDYKASPGTAFLKYCLEVKDAIQMCKLSFKTNKDGKHSKDARDSLQHLVTAVLPAIMGHFETYQKYLFAGMFDFTVFLKEFNVSKFGRLVSDKEIELNIELLSAYRNTGAPVGSVIADTLRGWHNPESVNKYFNGIIPASNFFSSSDISQLKVLWQFRHSIVHTGGSITLPDAQKVKELKTIGNKKIAFEDNFILEVARKFHPIVKSANIRAEQAFKLKLLDGVSKEDKNLISNLFKVTSSYTDWLK